MGRCLAWSGWGNDTTSRSRGSICPRLAIEFPYPPKRGRRECRVHAAPAVSCAIDTRNAHTSIQGSGGIRHSLRNGFTAYIVLSPVGPGSLSPSPVRSLLLTNLTPASGRQDHTTSPSAISTVVGARPSLTSQSPPCENVLRTRHCRGHRSPHPTSVTIAIRPSCGRGMAGVVGVIWGWREAEYFCAKGWTGFE
jgi:hypothetical protein